MNASNNDSTMIQRYVLDSYNNYHYDQNQRVSVLYNTPNCGSYNVWVTTSKNLTQHRKSEKRRKTN
jgi:hypothetical protein